MYEDIIKNIEINCIIQNQLDSYIMKTHTYILYLRSK